MISTIFSRLFLSHDSYFRTLSHGFSVELNVRIIVSVCFFQQLNSDRTETDTRWRDGDYISDMPSSNTASCAPVEDENNRSDNPLMCTWEMDEGKF